MQHLESAELVRVGTFRVIAELLGFILSGLSIKEKHKSPYVVYPPQRHLDSHGIQFYLDGGANIMIDMAIS